MSDERGEKWWMKDLLVTREFLERAVGVVRTGFRTFRFAGQRFRIVARHKGVYGFRVTTYGTALIRWRDRPQNFTQLHVKSAILSQLRYEHHIAMAKLWNMAAVALAGGSSGWKGALADAVDASVRLRLAEEAFPPGLPLPLVSIAYRSPKM